MTFSPTPNAVIARNPDVVSAEVSDDLILLNTKTWVYLEIDDIGARIWNILETPRSFAALIETLVHEFDVDHEVCAANTDAFLQYLTENGFLGQSGSDPS